MADNIAVTPSTDSAAVPVATHVCALPDGSTGHVPLGFLGTFGTGGFSHLSETNPLPTTPVGNQNVLMGYLDSAGTFQPYTDAHPLPIGPVSGASGAPIPVAGTVTAITSGSGGSISGTVSVSNFPASQAVTVGNFPANQGVTVGNFPATQPVSGTIAVSNFPSSQNVVIQGGIATTPTPRRRVVGTAFSLFPAGNPAVASNGSALSTAIFNTAGGSAGDGYATGRITFRGTFGAAPAVNAAVSVWLLTSEDAGATYEDPSMVRLPDAVIPLDSVNTAQIKATMVDVPGGYWKALVLFSGTGQTVSAGWTLSLLPVTTQ